MFVLGLKQSKVSSVGVVLLDFFTEETVRDKKTVWTSNFETVKD